MIWDSFDRFFCISVRERTDRRTHAQLEFARVGLADRVEFLLVDKHPVNPEQGIYESHMACMREGIRAGAQTIAIFEDDVIFDRFDPVTLQRCAAFLASQEDWRICYWGCLVARSWRSGNPSVRRIKYRSLSHAYVVNRPFAEGISCQPWEGVPFDDFLQRFEQGVYTVYPTFAFQSDSPSDNDNRLRLESFRKRIGGLRRIQKMNEYYHCHRGPIIALHVLLVLSVLMVIL